MAAGPSQPAEQHGVAGLHPQRRRVGRGRTVTAEADRRTGGAEVGDRGDAAAADHHVRARAVRHTDARSRPAGRPRRRSGRCSAPPTSGRCTQPTSSKCSIGAPAERLLGEAVLVGVLGQVGVQADVEPLGQLGGGRMRSGVTENGEHGASAMRTIAPGRRVVVRRDQALAVGEDLVVVLHHRVGRQAAVLLARGSSSPGSGGSACRARRGA